MATQSLPDLIREIVASSTDIDQAVETLKDYFDEKDSHFSRRYLRLLIEKHSGTTTPNPTPITPRKEG